MDTIQAKHRMKGHLFPPRDSLFSDHFNLSDSRRHLQLSFFFYTWNRKPLFITDWRQAILQCWPLAARPAQELSPLSHHLTYPAAAAPVPTSGLSQGLTSTLSALVLGALAQAFSALIQSNPGHFTAEAHSTTLQTHLCIGTAEQGLLRVKLTTAYLN